MAAPAPPIAPSPMPQMGTPLRKCTAAAGEDSGIEGASAGAAGRRRRRAEARPATASAGLTTLRERMDRIAAKAAGNAGVAHDTSGGSVPPASAAEQRVTFEDLQARMERIRANAASGTF